MSLKIEFVERAAKDGAKLAPLCREYGISRQTGHKWLKRYREQGHDGLEDRSRRPLETPTGTGEEMVLAVLKAREAHPRWGPKKLVVVLRRAYGDSTPSRATIARILLRFGKVRDRRRKAVVSITDHAPEVVATAPNDVWSVDFKGWWRTQNGSRCEPLTVRDAFSRFVLRIAVMSGTAMEAVRHEFEALFRKYGLPRAIQCDNGAPFICVQARGGLTRLSAWWVSLGIRVIRSRPGCPQDNGGHERMHRDVSADVQALPDETPLAAQRALNRWRQEFNHVRPHEALDSKVPAELYRPSERRSLARHRYAYPPSWIVRTVYGVIGRISVFGQAYPVGRALTGHAVALEPLDGPRRRVWFGNVDLGLLQLAPSTMELDQACQRFLERPVRGRKKMRSTEGSE